MKKRKFVLLLAVLAYLTGACAQDKAVVITYNIPSKQLSELNIQKLGLRAVFSTDPDFSYSLKNKKTGTVKLNLLTRGLYKIADGFYGHTIYLEDGDTISITLRDIPNLDKILAKGIFLSHFNSLTASGKYAWHYTFFDEFTKRTEKLYPKTKTDIPQNLLLYKSKCDKALLLGNKLLDSLYSIAKITQGFKAVAEQELNALYVSHMCSPLSMVSKEKINPVYFEKLNTLTFNDSSYAVMCNNYIQAGALYTYYIHNSLNIKSPYSNLANEMRSILLNYSGIIKDKLLSWQILDYIGKDYPSFDSCYQVFLSECKNPILKNSVIKKVDAYVKPLKLSDHWKLEDIMTRTKIQDASDNRSTIISKSDDSLPTLIDCWATWCIPCKNQMPFMHEFEKKYKGKLNVIYLSFDKDEIKWKSFIRKNRLTGNQFIIDNDFSSEFAGYFDISEIPRYILLSKGGLKVLNAKMPLPALQEIFEEELRKFLN